MNVDLVPPVSRDEVSPSDLQAVKTTAELYRQANAIGRSSQDLDLPEKRLIVLALSAIDHRSTEPDLEVVIPLRAFEQHGVSNPYDRAKQAAKTLPGRVVVIPREDGGFTAYPWLQHLVYVPADDSDLGYSYIRLKFNEHLRPWITNLRSHYAILPIRDVLQMPSSFSARLYEVLWHVSMGGKRPQVELGLMELKFALGLVERDAKSGKWTREKYQDWRDFRKQLGVAISAIDEHGSISASYKGLRVGRKIGKVRFDVRVVRPIPHLRMQPPLLQEDPVDSEERRIAQGLKDNDYVGSASQAIKDYTAPVVQQAIKMTERQHRKGPLRNRGGFLRACLKDGTAERELALELADRANRATSETAPSRSDEEELQIAWEAHRREVAQAIIQAEELEDDAVVTLVQDELRKEPTSRVYFETLKAKQWSGPSFDVAATRAVLHRYKDRAPATALDLQEFQEVTFGEG